MIKAEDLRDRIVNVLKSGEFKFPASSALLSNAIKSYIMANGIIKPPAISYTLGPATGASWANLIPLSGTDGPAKHIIQAVIAHEFAASVKMIPSPTGPIPVPMVFNTGVVVDDLTKIYDFEEVWLIIADAIVKFFKTEIE